MASQSRVTRRIPLSWVAFGKLSHILRDKSMSINLRRKVYYTGALPVSTYRLEITVLTQTHANKLRVMQRAMERSIFGVRLRDGIRNE